MNWNYGNGRPGGELGAVRLLADGLVANPDALASVRDYIDTATGLRAMEVRLAGGLSFEVFPDRGLDIGSTWWNGSPISWRSPHDLSTTASIAANSSWLARWSGGLVTTCGPDNIGPERDGYPMHGSHHSTRASNVRWTRSSLGDQLSIVITGSISNFELFERQVVVHREIEAGTGNASIEIRDRISNDGNTVAAVPLMYHVNFGAPFLQPGGVVRMPPAVTTSQESGRLVKDPVTFPQPTKRTRHAGFEHKLSESSQGDSCATLYDPSMRRRVAVSWTSSSLPRLYQWRWLSRGGWVLSVEPSNAPLFGADREGQFAGAPLLEPGESFSTRLRIQCEEEAK